MRSVRFKDRYGKNPLISKIRRKRHCKVRMLYSAFFLFDDLLIQFSHSVCFFMSLSTFFSILET